MDTQSFWKAISKRTKNYPSLLEDIEVDVAIVGGGITGMTAALNLTEAGKKVALLEADTVASGTTGYSTGNLYVPIQPYYHCLLKKFDEETVRDIAQSRHLAIDIIEKIIEVYKIECNFNRRPWYIFAANQEEAEVLTQEYNTLKNAGQSIDYSKELPFNLRFNKAAVMENQARFNPMQYVIDLAEVLEKKGCLIFENSRVLEYEEKKRCHLKTAAGKVTAKDMIIATHTPIGINKYSILTAPYRSYVVAAKLEDKHYPECHLWNLSRPHYAVCTHASAVKPNHLMVAGSHHKTGQGEDMKSHFKELERYLNKHYDISEFAYHWSAQHYQTADDAPYIGLANHSVKHTYIAAGYFADGLVYGTIAGVLLSDLINKKYNPYQNTFNSNRIKPFASAAFCIGENLNVLGQYLKDLPLTKPSAKVELKKCEGRVVEIKGEKYGMYKDENNQIKIVSAVCTHMKCIVNFNSAEKTWDCPCHGSRFTVEGKVIEGPAIQNLTRFHSGELKGELK